MTPSWIEAASQRRRRALRDVIEGREPVPLGRWDRFGAWLSRNFGWYCASLAMALFGGLWMLWRW